MGNCPTWMILPTPPPIEVFVHFLAAFCFPIRGDDRRCGEVPLVGEVEVDKRLNRSPDFANGALGLAESDHDY